MKHKLIANFNNINMKAISFTIVALLISASLFGQDFFDAVRFSQTQYGGTARSISMGNAFGALGGDFISASINPAGMGIYRSGELAFSPTLNINNIESNFLGNKYNDNKYNFNFNNLSYVSTFGTGVESGIVNVTMGFGYNRIKNFHSNFRMQADGATSSLLNYYTAYANAAGHPDKFDYHYEGLAWNAYLIDEDTDLSVLEGVYYNDLANYNSYNIVDGAGNVLGTGYELSGVKPHAQRKTVSTSGKIDEYLFTMAANINHKFYVGGSLGLLNLDYYESSSFTETDNENLSEYFDSYALSRQKRVSGMGINFKLGIIYRPVKSLRLGAAIHTPNFFALTSDETKTINSYFNKPVGGETKKNSWSDDNNQYFDYNFESPFKAVFSAAYMIGKVGMISVDYDYINYAGSKFRDAGDGYDYTDKNNEVQSYLKSTGDLRVGAEVRATPNVSLRAGYGLMGNPWQSTVIIDNVSANIINSSDKMSSYSVGAGYRQQHFFIDIAYRLTNTSETYKVFEMLNNGIENPGSNMATLNGMNHQTTLTLGFRF